MTRPLFQAMLCLGASLTLSCADDASTPNPIDTNTAQAPLKHFCKALTDKDDDGVIDIIEENQFGPNGSFIYTVKYPLMDPDKTSLKHEVNTDKKGRISKTYWSKYPYQVETKYSYNDTNQLIEIITTQRTIDNKTQQTIVTLNTKKFTYYDDGSLKSLLNLTTDERGTNEFITEYTHKENTITAKTTYIKPERLTPTIYTKEIIFNENGKLSNVKAYDSRSDNFLLNQDFSYNQDGLLITSRTENTINRFIYQDGIIVKKISTNTLISHENWEKTITYDSEGRILKQETQKDKKIRNDVSFTYESNNINIYINSDTKPRYVLTKDQDNNIIKHLKASQRISTELFPAVTTTYDYSCLQGKPPVEPILPAACNIQATTLDEYRKQPCSLHNGDDLQAIMFQVPAVNQYVSLLKEVAPYPSYLSHLNISVY